MSERAAKNSLTCFVPSDIKGEVEGACIARLGKTWVNPTFRVLHPESHRFVQRDPRLNPVVDQTDGDLPFLPDLRTFRHRREIRKQKG
jgi:hypothetical protein